MASVCNLDVEFADKINLLLKPPSPHEVHDYFDKLIKARQYRGISIKQVGEHGKGVYAETGFADGDLVLKDQMVVGAQHSSNKVDCLVCSHCFCFIGSIELQIGRKLYLQDLGLSASKDCVEMHGHTSKGFCLDDPLDGEENSLMMDHESSESCTTSDQDDKTPLPKEVIMALMNGDLILPHSDQFPLPSVVPCPGGCGEANYCSKLCADADWELFHSLLCTGKSSESSCREALMKFVQHANGTNDIFLPAAKAVSFTILNYKRVKATRLENQENHCSLNNSEEGFSLLLEAWKPLSMGYKKRWWDCIALPDDVGIHDEASFRQQITELAFTSLQLLREAIFDKECAPLFSLEIYGHIIGMFELNNLDLVVASPVEDYFLFIDDLPHPEKEKAQKVTRLFLDALGDDYSICCQGTAFFPIQSCMNHSCCPNAKAFKREEDRDGQATIIALRHISKEEEITISYIDEDLPFQERQVLLADYGFRCRCPKCVEDEP